MVLHNRIEAVGEVEVRNAAGRLIVRSNETEQCKHPFYHRKRQQWCYKHRNAWSPEGFREGRYNWFNFIFLITRF